MPVNRLSGVVIVSLLGACAPVETTPSEVDPSVDAIEGKEPGLAEIELCDAEDYRPLIGSNIASVSLPDDRMLRAFSVNDIVTQEYLPQRTNILYGAEGTIQRVFCG